MNRRLVFVSAFAAVLMMSVMVYGQQRGQGGRRGGGAVGMMGRGMSAAMLLRNEAVQKDLGVTDEQKTKVKEIMTAGRQAPGERPDFQNMSQEERQKWMEDRAKAAAEQMKKVAAVLDKKQMARLEEIRIQAMGTAALMDEDVAKKLEITDEQKEKLQTAQREAMQEMRDAGQPGPETFAKMREKMAAKVKEVLTEKQQTMFKEMSGKPFDTAALRGAPGGRGGRGGRGN